MTRLVLKRNAYFYSTEIFQQTISFSEYKLNILINTLQLLFANLAGTANDEIYNMQFSNWYLAKVLSRFFFLYAFSPRYRICVRRQLTARLNRPVSALSVACTIVVWMKDQRFFWKRVVVRDESINRRFRRQSQDWLFFERGRKNSGNRDGHILKNGWIPSSSPLFPS